MPTLNTTADLTADQKATALLVLDHLASRLDDFDEFAIPRTVEGVRSPQLAPILQFLGHVRAIERFDGEDRGKLADQYTAIRQQLAPPEPAAEKPASSKPKPAPSRELLSTYEHENAIHALADDMVTFSTMLAVNHLMRGEARRRKVDFRELTMPLSRSYVAKYRPISEASAQRGIARGVQLGLLRVVHEQFGKPTVYRAVVPAWWTKPKGFEK